MKRHLKRGDIWIAVLLVAAAGWFIVPKWFTANADSGAYANIMVDGEFYRKVALTEQTENITIQTKWGYNQLRVSKGGIEMIEADCPDKLCLTFGHTHELGDTIVCLPHRVFVEIIGQADVGGGPDAVVS